MSIHDTKSKIISFRLSDAEYAAVERTSLLHGVVSVSLYARAATLAGLPTPCDTQEVEHSIPRAEFDAAVRPNTRTLHATQNRHPRANATFGSRGLLLLYRAIPQQLIRRTTNGNGVASNTRIIKVRFTDKIFMQLKMRCEEIGNVSVSDFVLAAVTQALRNLTRIK